MTYIIFVLLTRHAIATTPACLPACLKLVPHFTTNELKPRGLEGRRKEEAGGSLPIDSIHSTLSLLLLPLFIHGR